MNGRWRIASHPPAGRPISLAALWRARHPSPGSPWPEHEARYFESGTAALAEAVRQRAQQMSTPVRVLLPAYGCPNLLAAVLAAEAKPEFVDIDADTLSMDASGLQTEIRRGECLIIWVDMFGVPTAEGVEPALRDRLIHDLAQSYAPYLPGWRAVASHTVVSFGRAKPLSLTEGGALLTAPVPNAGLATNAPPESLSFQRWAKLTLRAAIYNQCLGRLSYGLLRALPTGVGGTQFTPLDRIRALGEDTGRVAFELWRELEKRIVEVEACTRDLCELVERAGLPLHPLVRQGAARCLWRVPVRHRSASEAEFFANAAAPLGVSRLYGRSLPEFCGVSEAEARERWPKAWSFARQLTTLPTHGRLSDAQIRQLGTLLEASRAAG